MQREFDRKLPLSTWLRASCTSTLLLAWIATVPSLLAESPTPTDITPISDADNEFFEKKVRPLLHAKCLDCHSGEDRGGGLSLAHRNHLVAGGDSGAALDREKPSESLILRAIRYDDEVIQMPPDGKLSAEEIAILEDWIARGAPDPREEESIETSNPALGMSVEAGRDFWSFRPIANHPVPTLDNDDWSRHPIDRFIYGELRSHGLTPAAPASRRDWLRRVTQDLIGLPPTMEEIQAFEQDDAPDAFEKIVDRLLDSPQYGVRWGRHWLDTVRYADSNGLDENLAYGTAWRYRDYVISSWNQNKPFDRFLQEQLAGDLLPDRTQESHIGTGFLVLGAKVLAEPDKEKLFADTIDEQIDCFGKVFLGMTFGCVRCHDHKFDPVLQSDYYSLSAIFKSTKSFGDTNTGAIKHWREISFASPEENEGMKKVQGELAAKQGAYNQARAKAFEALRVETRSKVLDYLSASMELAPDALLSDCIQIASERGLHPRALLQCRTFLARFPDSPLFQFWNDCYAKQDKDGMREYYAKVFDPNSDATPELKELAAKALADRTGFLAIPAKIEHALQPEQVTEILKLAEEARIFESNAPDESTFMGVTDGEIIDTTPIHIRGNHISFGERVSKNFPAVFISHSSEPVFSRRQSGRLELAQWLTSPTHPLTARVFANRLWRWHFGKGIVSTTDNFGVLGDPPSHPKLLDFLARELIASEWNIKGMQREIVLSSTYRMATHHSQEEKFLEVDPENRLLWKFHTQRLEAEQIRDSLLFVFGKLDMEIGGKTVPLRNRQFVFDHTSIDHTKYGTNRRTAYFPIIRNNLAPLLRLFDYPDPTMPTGSRPVTSVAPQSLLLMNAEWVMDAAASGATRIASMEGGMHDRIHAAFEMTLARGPNEHEIEVIEEYIRSEQSTAKDAQAKPALQDERTSEVERDAWARVLQSLVLGNEFIFTD